MAIAIAGFFEQSFSKESHKRNNRIIVLMLGGMVFILLLVLVSFTLGFPSEQLDPDDFPFLQIDGTAWMTVLADIGSLTLGSALSVLILLLRLEYLMSHMGEKRPSRQTASLNKIVVNARFAPTALFHSAVFFVPSVRTAGSMNRISSVFARGRST